MKLADHFTRSGDVLFRWRSYFPLLLLPLFALTLLDVAADGPGALPSRGWQLACLAVSAAGLVLRICTIGTAPAGTSERSTVDPRASALNTAGIYSVMRHPLYLGNTLVAIGLAAMPGRWYLPVIVCLAGLLYHERIAAREEAFLEERFGEAFRAWADRVPALVPRPGWVTPSPVRFNWRDVIRREVHGLLVIGAGFFVFDLAERAAATGRLQLDWWWTGLLLVTAATFAVVLGLKKLSRVLDGR